MKKMIIHENKWIWGITQILLTHQGNAIIRIEYIDDYPDLANIEGLSVLKEYRKKGYATEIIELAEKEIKKKQKKTINLSLEKDNEYLFKFYSKLGYNLYDEDDNYKYMSKNIKE